MRLFGWLLLRKFWGIKNSILSWTAWEWFKRIFFITIGLVVLSSLYFLFARVLRYFENASIIGALLTWKLTAMMFLMTFSMVAISTLITAVSTLYFSADLKFLMSSPIPPRILFMDKSIETIFFASWMVAMVTVPYIMALARVKALPWTFYPVFAGFLIPFLMLAAAIGIAFTLILMASFPSPRTRDAVWLLSSCSLAVVYALIRFSQPEKLINPSALERVGQYLEYLQAPTAPYLPSWWMTQALTSFSGRQWLRVLLELSKILLALGCIYGALLWAAGRIYEKGFSGSQEGWRRNLRYRFPHPLESNFSSATRPHRQWLTLFWKDRLIFFRDVKHWSQLMLILSLTAVYLFSIWKIPLDIPALKSLLCFFNIGTTGAVLTALALRFAFPAVSMEGKSFWILKSAPMDIQHVMREKFIFNLIPIFVLGTLLVAASNYLLKADLFISTLSLITIWLCALTLSAMAVGLGAVFPKFNTENIHQIESSAGGFVYMACALGYLALTLVAEAFPVRLYYSGELLRDRSLYGPVIAVSMAALLAINWIGLGIPWRMGRKTLKSHEV